MRPASFDELLRRLAEAEAQFVVIGGLALGARGVVRATKDIDVVVASDPANLKRIAEVAVAAGGHVQKGEAPDQFRPRARLTLGRSHTTGNLAPELPRPPRAGSAPSIAALLAVGKQVTIETELGRLDVVQGLEGVPSFEELRSRASEAEVLGVKVAVCSVEDLRAMKRAAGRTRDIADLEDLDAVDR